MASGTKKRRGPRMSTGGEEGDWDEASAVDEQLATLVAGAVPAILDGQVQGQEDDTEKVQAVQQAVLAANAAQDHAKRAWTQARQLMNEVNRNRGYFPVGLRRTTGKDGRKRTRRQEQGQE